MSEEEVSIKLLGKPIMLGELSAVVSRQRMDAGRKRRQQRNHGVRDGLGGLGWDVGEQRVAGRTQPAWKVVGTRLSNGQAVKLI